MISAREMKFEMKFPTLPLGITHAKARICVSVSLSPLGVSRGMGSAEQASLAPRVRRRGGAQWKEGWVRRWPAPSQRTPPILGPAGRYPEYAARKYKPLLAWTSLQG